MWLLVGLLCLAAAFDAAAQPAYTLDDAASVVRLRDGWRFHAGDDPAWGEGFSRAADGRSA